MNVKTIKYLTSLGFVACLVWSCTRTKTPPQVYSSPGSAFIPARSNNLTGAPAATFVPDGVKVEQGTWEELSNAPTISLEEITNTINSRLSSMSPLRRRQYVKQLISAGFTLNLPEVLTDVDDAQTKMDYLERLKEPFSDAMLDVMEKVASAEQNPELKLKYGAYLYRFGHKGAVPILESFLSNNNTIIRGEVALALNQQDSSTELLVQAMESQTNLWPGLITAMGKWQNRSVQDFIRRLFAKYPRSEELALGVALGDGKEYLPQIEKIFKRRKNMMQKVLLAAASSRLSPDPNDNEKIKYLFDLFERSSLQTDPIQADQIAPVYVVEAIGYASSNRSELFMRGLIAKYASTQPSGQKGISGAVAGKAAVFLADNLTPENTKAIAAYLEKAKLEDLSTPDRNHFVCSILNNKGYPKLREAISVFVSTNIIAVTTHTNIKEISPELLPPLPIDN